MVWRSATFFRPLAESYRHWNLACYEVHTQLLNREVRSGRAGALGGSERPKMFVTREGFKPSKTSPCGWHA